MRKLLVVFILISSGVIAENVVSIYGGYQVAAESRVIGVDQNGNVFNFTAQWEGKSFTPSPYYGFRFTHWYENDWGVSLDFTHAKAYADSNTLQKSGFDRLEFSDGLNILTVNAFKRYPSRSHDWVLYWGVGVGISVPYVHVYPSKNSPRTDGFQLAGAAFQGLVGVTYPIVGAWSLFTELKVNHTINDIDLDEGGNLQTNITTSAINFGVNYSF